ncbi:MAG: helicase C-terminal domain-containing protein [Mariprofundus sp.]|nr:helicase C-terminal domain-containing protein [Mariprofundus sp.]
MSRLNQYFDLLYAAGRKRRDGQVAMAEAIQASIIADAVCVCEAGTGIGKSFAVLLAAITARELALEQANEDDALAPIIYSTGTVALQSQIVENDLPTLLSLIKSDFTFALAKGRGRYACTKKIHELLENRHQGLLIDSDKQQEDIDLYGNMADLLKADKWDGDLDDYAGITLRPEHVREVTIEGASCTKRRCPDFNQCPFFRARKEMRSKDIVVVNHALLLSDLALGGGVILPCKVSETTYLIDEAHRLPETAVSHFGSMFSVSGSTELFTGFAQACNRLLRLTDAHTELQKLLAEALKKSISMVESLRQIGQSLSDNVGLFDEGEYLFKSVPDFFKEPLKRLQDDAGGMAKSLSKVVDVANKDKENELDPRLVSDAGFYLSKVQNITETITRLFDDASKPPIAKWIDEKGLLHAYPVSASQLLFDGFWKEVKSAALFSATIRAVGRFDKFFTASGLDLMQPAPAAQQFKSSFDYSKSRLLVINDGPEPNAAEHLAMVSTVIHGAIKKASAGILVIFTSRKMMHGVRDNLIKTSKSLTNTILSQGDCATKQLLQKHRRAINKGKVSVLFGLASFGEGLDLPGKLCETVIIPRIPFAVPNTPLERARVDWIVSIGGNPFFDLALPNASIKLTQMVGRLIRSEEDQGNVIILDNRIMQKRYGPELVRNLPGFRFNQFSIASIQL